LTGTVSTAFGKHIGQKMTGVLIGSGAETPSHPFWKEETTEDGENAFT